MNWISAPLTLQGDYVDLVSLDPAHFPGLKEVALEKHIWEFYSVDGSDPAIISQALDEALVEREKGNHFPFTIVHKKTGAIIGSTRFTDMAQAHRKLEIGWTWLHPDHWASVINPECKMLLLSHAFETLQCCRVQLRTDVLNIRSQKAIQKIGGIYEGTFRNDLIRTNGTHRDSMYFSIVDRDWPMAKVRLRELIGER